MFSFVLYQTFKFIKTHPQRITKANKKMVNNLDYEGAGPPVPKTILARWKRKIIFSLIYFSYEDKLTYHVYISHQEFENCMGLLLISDENK